MEQRLWMILQLFGGAALFLYSMDTLTDALQQAAGDTLRQALARLTAHPLAGVLTGAAVTAVVQSSSAVTVLVLGLVGAGLLTLQRAVPVVFGANIGTTVTAQLLAFRLEDARYLLLVAGLLLWFAGRGRLHAAGQALFAFGLLFEGIAVMAEAMEPLAAGPVFRQWMAQVRHRPGLGLLAGLGMTLAVQSSSATIAVLQRAADRPGPDGGCLLGHPGAVGGQHRHHRHGGAGIGGAEPGRQASGGGPRPVQPVRGGGVLAAAAPVHRAGAAGLAPRAGERRAGPADRQRPHPVQSGLHGAVAAPDPLHGAHRVHSFAGEARP